MILHSTYYKVKVYALFVLLILILGGCKTSFKQNFRDFRAHYNTFFNAKKSYESGLKKNEAQLREYNPYVPIRVHQKPVNAGGADFQQSIDKGADIIRKHSTSKWVDDAIELIGKSYYYRQEYFSADQKFQELYNATTNVKLRQNSVYWRGRTYLELELHQEAINYLTEQLAIFSDNWIEEIEAEVRVVLAQHYVELQNFNAAETQLAQSVSKLKSKPHKARGYFLYGQILEQNGKPEEAFNAYARVENYYSDYNLFFLSRIKNGQISRDLGNWNSAYNTFQSMARDDKNVERQADLDYELARTEQVAGNYESAENIYYSVLGNEINKPAQQTIAKSYYGLAEINRSYYNDFSLAAAYYDSAAQQRIPTELLPANFNAEELATSFGEYSTLTQSIHLSDSLLWLSTLNEVELDSVVLELKKKRRDEILEELRQEEVRKNTLVNVSNSTQNQAQNNQRNGFLNYKNPVLVADARSQFQAIWGDRPLADNWRRAAAIQASIANSTSFNNTTNSTNTSSGSISLNDIQIDLSKIPTTDEQRDIIRMSLAEELFQLGNLFFLSLNMPDSAEYYFLKVQEDYPNSTAAPVAIYSLSELSINQNNALKARSVADELIERYPSTIYAERLRNRYGISEEKISTKSTYEDSLKTKYLTYQSDDIPILERVDSLKVFAIKHAPSQLSEVALYDVIRLYSEVARDSLYIINITKYNEEINTYKQKEQLFRIQQDSANIALADTSLSKEDSVYWRSILNSKLEAPSYDQHFPYNGAYWDSVRSNIKLYQDTFPEGVNLEQVQLLSNELKPPEKEVVESIDESQESSPFYSCTDIEITPKIAGGKDQFLASLKDEDVVLLSDFVLNFQISEKGDIVSYRIISPENQSSEFIDRLESVIDDYLLFEVTMYEGSAIPIQCDITLPANLNRE